MSRQTKHLYEFGNFTLDVEESRLLRDGLPVPLKPKVLETLFVLVESSGHVIGKKELMQRLWPDSFVEEANLAVNISQLRKALGDDESGDHFIETVPKRGYRFAAQVTRVLADRVDLIVHERTRSHIVIDEEETSADGISVAKGTERFPAVSRRVVILPTSRTPGGSLLGALEQYKAPLLVIVACITIGVVVLAVAINRLLRQNAQKGFHQMVISRITWTGDISRAALSPDGKYVAYTILDSKKESLWITNVVTKSSIRVIPPADTDYEGLTFSPDGNYLYFDRYENDVNTVFEMPVFGGPFRKVAKDSDGHVAVSPDGKQIAFIRKAPTLAATELIVASVDGSGERKLATRKAPDFFFSDPDGLAWSPDGKLIACRGGSTDANGLYRNVVGVRVEDGTEMPISSQRWKWIGGVGWLRDGSGLVITASDQQAGAQSQQVWQLSYPGGEAQKITNDLSGYRGMSLAADSTTILTLQQNTSSSVWVAPADDYSKARQLTRGSYDGGLGVSWAPDGSILYSSRSGGTDQIWIMDADGNNQKQLTTGPAMKRSPAATPDGRYIVFYAFGPETQISNIWRMDIDGGNPKQLTKGNTDGWPQCSADSKWVLYTDHDSPTSYTTWKVAIEGGEAVPLTATASANSAISPDGTLVACANWDHNPNKLAIIPFAGGPPLKLFDVPADIHYSSLRWRADGGAVSYNLDQGSKVWIQPLNGGPAGELLDFQPDWVWLSDWSRDGKQLVIARGRTTSDAVLISNFR